MRRAAGIVLALGALSATGPGLAQQQSGHAPRVGILVPGAPPRDVHDAFRAGLRDLGYVEGRTVQLEERWTGGDSIDHWPAIVANLLAADVAVILAGTTNAAVAARRATRSVPIVAVSLTDPIRLGLIDGYARPGGNVTGLQLITSELIEKRLQLAKEAIPGLTHVALLSPEGETAAYQTEAAQAAAQALGLTVMARVAGTLEALADAMTEARAQRVGAVVLVQGAFFRINQSRIADLARRERLPTVAGETGFAAAGGLMNYGAAIPENWRRAALYVDKILKGANPADLPIEQPAKYEFAINLRTAKELGLDLPLSLLAGADEVIE